MKMSEAMKLMIGDWVYLKKSKDEPTWCGLAQITEIVEDCVSLDLKEKVEDFPGSVAFHAVEPIPLTAEILEKNFDEYLPGINLMYELKGPYMISCEEENLWVFGLTDGCGRYPLVKISYVHELQHALRLCGIDKEIEL